MAIGKNLARAIYNHTIPRDQSAHDDPQTFDLHAEHDVLAQRAIPGPQHVHVFSILVRQHGLIVDQQRVLHRIANQLNTGEQPRRKDVIFVREQRARVDRAGRRVQMIVDERHFPPMRETRLRGEADAHRIARVSGAGPRAGFGQFLVLQIDALIAFERDINRINGHQGRQNGDAGDNQIAGPHQRTPDPPIDGRRNARETDRQSCLTQLRGGRVLISERLFQFTAALLEFLDGRGVNVRQFLGARQLRARHLNTRRSPSPVGAGVVGTGPVLAIVDRKQQVALAYIATFVKMHPGQIATDARPQIDRFDRFNAAAEFVPLRDGSLHDGRHIDAGGRRRWRAGPTRR